MAKRANVRTVEEKKSARSLQRDATLLRRSPQFRWILPSKIGRQLPVAALGQGNARTCNGLRMPLTGTDRSRQSLSEKRLSLTLTLTPVFQGMRVHKVPGVETGKQVLRLALRQLPPIRPSLPPQLTLLGDLVNLWN